MSPTAETQPKRRAYLAKEVIVDEEHYRTTHRRNPRGYGMWLFAPSYAANETRPTGEPLTRNEAREQLHNVLRAYLGTYAQARAQAKRDAAATATTRTDILITTLP